MSAKDLAIPVGGHLVIHNNLPRSAIQEQAAAVLPEIIDDGRHFSAEANLRVKDPAQHWLSEGFFVLRQHGKRGEERVIANQALGDRRGP